MPWASVTELRTVAWAALGRRKKGLPPLSHLALGWSSHHKWGHLDRDATILPAIELWKQPQHQEELYVIPQVAPWVTSYVKILHCRIVGSDENFKRRWATSTWMVLTHRATDADTQWLTFWPFVDLLRAWAVSFLRCAVMAWQDITVLVFANQNLPNAEKKTLNRQICNWSKNAIKKREFLTLDIYATHFSKRWWLSAISYWATFETIWLKMAF